MRLERTDVSALADCGRTMSERNDLLAILLAVAYENPPKTLPWKG
jgi:hypothetical protein